MVQFMVFFIFFYHKLSIFCFNVIFILKESNMEAFILFIGLSCIIYQLDRLTDIIKQRELNITITSEDS